jgi:hypothetical protein
VKKGAARHVMTHPSGTARIARAGARGAWSQAKGILSPKSDIPYPLSLQEGVSEVPEVSLRGAWRRGNPDILRHNKVFAENGQSGLPRFARNDTASTSLKEESK